MAGRESSQPETNFPPTEMPAWRAVGRLLWPFVIIAAVTYCRSLDPAWIDCADTDPSLAIVQCSIVLERGDGDGLWSWIYRSLHDRSLAYLHRGDAHLRREDHEQAVADYDMAIGINPRSSQAYCGRGVAYLRMGDYRRAMEDGRRALDLNPSDARAHYLRGRAYAGVRDYVSAIKEYDAAIELHPNYAAVYRYRGDAYSNEGSDDHAIADYFQAISIDPNLSPAADSPTIEQILYDSPKALIIGNFQAH